jgi:RNA polymerase sigma factor (sigma-70 family)
MVIIVILTAEEFSLLKKRDRVILTKLYDHYSEGITTYFMVKTFGNVAVAEDLTQETFYAIIKAAPQFKDPQYLKFTIFSIARNKLSDYQRALFRQKKRLNHMKEVENRTNDMIKIIDQKQKLLLLKLAYESLNPFYQEVYDMYFIKDMGIKEIAAHYQKTYKAINNVLVRIRKALKKEMKSLAKNFFEGQ